MKEVSTTGVRQLSSVEENIMRDPHSSIGRTQEMFLSLTKKYLPLHKGVRRFKTHAAMNAHWDAAEQEIVRMRQQEIRAHVS